MILQEKIRQKSEGYGKLAPVFLEGAKFALENQWISVDDDLPCNHKELMVKDEKGRWETKRVLVRIKETDTSFKKPYFADCMMSKWDGEESYES